MKTILIATMEQLQKEIPEFRYIGEDFGQVDFYDTSPSVKFPCALININLIRYETISKEKQRANVTLQVRLIDDSSIYGNIQAPKCHQQKAFEIFDLMEAVRMALQGFHGELFREFKLESIVKQNRQDYLREYILTYQTGFILSLE